MEEDAVGVVEIILILVVLISLVIIFKEQLTALVKKILNKNHKTKQHDLKMRKTVISADIPFWKGEVPLAGNVKKGSITIFLALILSLVLSLVCASIESVRMAAARTQILNSMDIGLYSLFGQYDRTLLEDYELFALYAGGKEELDMASVYDDFQTYMKPVLKQNSQKLELLQGGFNGYQLLSDGKGEIFYQQAVQYMRETRGKPRGYRLFSEN